MWFRWILPSLALAAFVVLTGRAVHDLVRTPPPNVIVLTVESWRADTATAELMPNLFEAAKRGVRFTRHRAVSAWTAPNIVAALTGVSPFEQAIVARGHSLPAGWTLPLEQLDAAGWEVAGLQAFMLIDVFRNLGVEVEAARDPLVWIAERTRARTPFVLWYHYLETHLPYAPGAEFGPSPEALAADDDQAGRLRAVATSPAIPAGAVAFEPRDAKPVGALYEGGLREFDAWFARFWAFFRQSGLDRNTILVVTADHGEELLERGNVGHASTTREGNLYEEVVRIPLFVWTPEGMGALEPGSVVDRPSDHLDIMPTILEWLGIEPARASAGTRLDAEGRGRPWLALTSRAGFSEPDPDDVREFVAASIEGRSKAQIRYRDGVAVERTVVDLDIDPGEAGPGLAVSEQDREVLFERIDAAFADRRRPERRRGEGASVAEAAPPRWMRPAQSGFIAYRDIDKSAVLEWSGDPDETYILAYEAGRGLLSLEGQIEVAGTYKDFGAIDPDYWSTWIVPYGRAAFRVRPATDPDAWSPWLDLRLVP